MKISVLIEELQYVLESYGDIEAQLQNSPSDNELIINEAQFFVVPEEYEDGFFCNIRTWPY